MIYFTNMLINREVKYTAANDPLSAVFAALADPTRRAILAKLSQGEFSVNQLAEPFNKSLPAISRHLKVLEQAGLISRTQKAQWRPRKLETRRLKEAFHWMEDYRNLWDQSLTNLDRYLLTYNNITEKGDAVYHTKVTQAGREVTFERDFEAPRELVFHMFAQAERLTTWWAPNKWSMPVCEIDFREGGTWHHCLEGPQGERKWVKAVYQTIRTPELIVYASTACDDAGNELDEPELDTLVSVSFTEQHGKTHLVSRTTFTSPDRLRASVARGMVEETMQGWEKLANRTHNAKESTHAQ